MMLEHIQRMNKDNVTDSMMMEVWKKVKNVYIFFRLTFQSKYRKKEKHEKLKCRESY